MAKMIPAQLDTSVRSGAERQIFTALRDAPETEDWVVLHSLNLTARDKLPFGEVDFVLLVPHAGVFALEVKGGGVSVADGAWHSIDREGNRHSLRRSPFRQAQEGMWELRDCLIKAVGEQEMGRVVFGSAALFPDTDFAATSPEWASWEALDRLKCGPRLVAALRAMMKEHAGRLRQDGSAFTPSVLKKARHVLRPDFECLMAASATLHDGEQHLVRLTEEQYGALDLMEYNDRLMCEGSAGTGKTLLALELARREARQGRRTILLCFNKLLGTWLAEQTAHEPLLTAGSFHQLARPLIEDAGLLPDFQERARTGGFWETTFPQAAWQAVVEADAPYDALVVDEAQDLCSALVLDVLDAWVRNGLMAGRCAIFADFHRQAIFGGAELRDLLVRRTPSQVRWRLQVNCRNTRRIARETALLSGFERPPYRMGQFDGLAVDSTFATDERDAAERLATRIAAYLKANGREENLVVLSPRRLDNSCAAHIRSGHGFVLIEAGEPAPLRSRLPVVRFATIQAFKGMESQAVILCDVVSLGEGEPQSLLYVGMSRARLQLTLVLSTALRSAYDACRARQFSPDWS